MAIVEILEKKLDARKGGDDCGFNGYLEDYILDIDELDMDESVRKALKLIAEEDNQTKVCVDLRMSVNKEAISNQIIRYKDVFKLTGKPIVLPFVIYGGRNGQERSLLIVPYEKYSYLYAKGYYYCMTEPGSDFASCKNEIVAMSSMSVDGITDAFKRLYSVTAGSLQRSIDHNEFSDYEALKEDAINCSEELKEGVVSTLSALEDKTDAIYKRYIK